MLQWTFYLFFSLPHWNRISFRVVLALRLPIAFILLISFVFRRFAFHLPFLYCFAKLSKQKKNGTQENEGKFSFIEIPYLAFSSSSRLHFKASTKKIRFRPSLSQIKQTEREKETRNFADKIGKGESLEHHNWWFWFFFGIWRLLWQLWQCFGGIEFGFLGFCLTLERKKLRAREKYRNQCISRKSVISGCSTKAPCSSTSTIDLYSSPNPFCIVYCALWC